MQALDVLCRLLLEARRLGCEVHITAPPELTELLTAVGLDEVFAPQPRHDHRPEGRVGRGGDFPAPPIPPH